MAGHQAYILAQFKHVTTKAAQMTEVLSILMANIRDPTMTQKLLMNASSFEYGSTPSLHSGHNYNTRRHEYKYFSAAMLGWTVGKRIKSIIAEKAIDSEAEKSAYKTVSAKVNVVIGDSLYIKAELPSCFYKDSD